VLIYRETEDIVEDTLVLLHRKKEDILEDT